MTKLLVSAKNLAEAEMLCAIGIDVIDLKDPNYGALAALPLAEIENITQKIKHLSNEILVSATIGDSFESLTDFQLLIQKTAACGVDIVKFRLDLAWLEQPEFFAILKTLSQQKITLFAVLFAEDFVLIKRFNWLADLSVAGIFGVMLDTQNKQKSLPEWLDERMLASFIDACKNARLASGVAGSLQLLNIENLKALTPIYMGFRGGLCQNIVRASELETEKVMLAKKMLQ